MTPFRLRSRLAPTRGRLGLVVVIVAAAAGWRVWHDLRHPPRHGRDLDAPVSGRLDGRPVVVDGDSLTIDGARIRLAGIDAPERAQSCSLAGMSHPCGDEAREHLAGLIGRAAVACTWGRLDKYGRRLARCRVGETDLGAAMVRAGWAVAYGGFEAEEAEARAHGRGLWSGRFEWPEDFRRSHRPGGAMRLFGDVPDREAE